jgi:hypothetical protein
MFHFTSFPTVTQLPEVLAKKEKIQKNTKRRRGKGKRQKINNSSLNFKGPSPLVFIYYIN